MKRTLLYLLAGVGFFLLTLGFFNHFLYNRIISSNQRIWHIERSATTLQQRKEIITKLSGVNPNLEFIAAHTDQEIIQCVHDWRNIANNGKGILDEAELRGLRILDSTILAETARLGFKDLGLIGKLRAAVHRLEKQNPELKADLLSLRRHEKDFLMRGDVKYIRNLHREATTLRTTKRVGVDLEQYLVYIDSASQGYLKLFSPYGLIDQWETRIAIQQNIIRKHRSQEVVSALKATRQARAVNIVFYLFVFLATMLVVTRLFKRVSRQLKILERAMSDYIASDYQHNSLEAMNLPRNEFGQIGMHFLRVSRKITRDVQSMEQQILKRTESIRAQHELLAVQHDEIRESLYAARELQRSLLPGETTFKKAFASSSLYYEPKNIVGGDFYWLHRTETPRCLQTILALADCTGHGVPGALLTFMGMNALDELIRTGRRKPAGLLNHLRRTIVRRMGHHGNRAEGMDIGIVQIDDLKKILTFSGANHSCWIIRKDGIVELDGQRMPIGYTNFEVASFENQHVKLQPHDKVFLFTDGLIDQFGGDRDKKFGRKQLRELVRRYSNEPLATLHLLLAYHFDSWKGNTEQTDDCTFILVEPLCTTAVSVVEPAEKIPDNEFVTL